MLSSPQKTTSPAQSPSAFLTDVQTLRQRAREKMEQGPVTIDYGIDPAQAVAVLNTALATELVCVLRYRLHYFMADGINSEAVANEFLTHSNEELQHADMIAKRIVQLGGEPQFSPDGLLGRSHSEYSPAGDLKEMIRENLFAERIAVESYREMIQFFRDHDPTTRAMLEEILATEEEHADELRGFLA